MGSLRHHKEMLQYKQPHRRRWECDSVMLAEIHRMCPLLLRLRSPKKSRKKCDRFENIILCYFMLKSFLKTNKLHSSERREASPRSWLSEAVIRESPLFEKWFLFYRFSNLLMFYYHLSNLHMCLTRGPKNITRSCFPT